MAVSTSSDEMMLAKRKKKKKFPSIYLLLIKNSVLNQGKKLRLDGNLVLCILLYGENTGCCIKFTDGKKKKKRKVKIKKISLDT